MGVSQQILTASSGDSMAASDRVALISQIFR